MNKWLVSVERGRRAPLSGALWLVLFACSGAGGASEGEGSRGSADEMDLSRLSVQRTDDGIVVSSDESSTRQLKCEATSCNSMCSVCLNDICEQLRLATCTDRVMICQNACIDYSCDVYEPGGTSPCDGPACDPRDPLCTSQGTKLDRIMTAFFGADPEPERLPQIPAPSTTTPSRPAEPRSPDVRRSENTTPDPSP